MIKRIFFTIFSIYLFFLIINSNINYYIHPQYKLFLGIMTLILLVFIIRDIKLEKVKVKSFLKDNNYIYIILILIIFLVAPAALGTSIVENRNLNIVAKEDILNNESPGPIINTKEFKVSDWINVQSVSSNLDNYVGRQVEVEGLFFNKNERLYVGKFTIACCAVDASLVGLRVDVPDSIAYNEGEWYEVIGTMDQEENEFKINIKELIEVDEPKQPYLTN